MSVRTYMLDRERAFDFSAPAVDAIVRGDIPQDMAVARRFGFVPRPLEGQFGDTAAACLKRFDQAVYAVRDVENVLALGLIGGGTAPAEAFAVVDEFVRQHPLAQPASIAFEVLAALFVGSGSAA